MQASSASEGHGNANINYNGWIMARATQRDRSEVHPKGMETQSASDGHRTQVPHMGVETQN